MANPYFAFKQFTIYHHHCAMKVTTDSCLFGAWVARQVQSLETTGVTALDIGTGSGLLSLMVAQKNNIHIHAIEIEPNAAQQAKENIAACPFKNKVTVIRADIKELTEDKKYTVIISNPPFYEENLASSDAAKTTAHHSSALTLRQLLSYIQEHLENEGNFFLLLPFYRLTKIKKLLPFFKLCLQNMLVVRQTENHKPFRVALQGSHLSNEEVVITKELTIKSNNQYTEEFKELLKDYYLHL